MTDWSADRVPLHVHFIRIYRTYSEFIDDLAIFGYQLTLDWIRLSLRLHYRYYYA